MHKIMVNNLLFSMLLEPVHLLNLLVYDLFNNTHSDRDTGRMPEEALDPHIQEGAENV